MQSHGPKKVACQQQRALLSLGIKEHYMHVFWVDFWAQIDEWMSKGDQLIICGDWNVDIRKKHFIKEFNKRELKSVNITRHGDSNLPATYSAGTKPIDEIFVTPTLQVTACGYLDHGSSLGDHRPVWVDIYRPSMLGIKGKLKPTYNARRLKTNDPRIVEKYNKTLLELLQESNVPLRAKLLLDSVQGELNQEQQEEYEILDKIRETSMKKAEKKCRKLKMGAVQWSPKLQKSMDTITYYTLCLRQSCGRKVSSSILYRLSKKIGCMAINSSKEELEAKLEVAYKNYKSVKKANQRVREAYLFDLAATLEKKGRGKKAKLVKQMIQTEVKRQMFRKLAMVHKKNTDLSTKFVTVTEGENKRIITDKKEMETAIINENKHKYHQTETTCPFMHHPLKQHFGKIGEGPKTEDALSGSYTPPEGLSPQTQEYIKLCTLPKDKLFLNPLTRSLDYYTDSWKKMKERTASRDLHFGHFKSATLNETIMNVHYTLSEIPFRSGYSPKRWREATNVMILKKAGEQSLDKLRTLVLFEADFNHNNKFFGKQMMHHMNDNKVLAQEQYSAPSKKCIDHVVNRRLFFDLIRYKKTSAAMSALDLKSCYDRIAHAPAYLAMRSYGMPAAPVISMFESIQQMKYYTFTSHGMSKKSFGGKEKGYTACPNGVGQGNGAGPAVWSVVSSKMFEVLRSRGSSSKIVSPLTGSVTDICGFAFVDDTDMIATTKNNNELEVTKRMQQIIDEWEAIAKCTGGALVPKKCWSWIISFEWKNDFWSYSNTAGDNSPSMTIKDPDDVIRPLDKLNPDEAREMLGVFLSPNGNNQAQKEKLLRKMTLLSEFIRTGHVSRHEAWASLNLMAMKSLEYSLPAMTLSEKDYTDIMRPVLKQFLPKIGLNRNFKRDLLYAPAQSQGINLSNPYIHQGVSHIADISEHLWKDTLTGQLMKANLEQLRIEIGDNVNIFDADFNKYKSILLTSSYLKNTWEFVHKNNIKLKDPIAPVTKLRNDDTFIMNDFMTNPEIPESHWAKLNRCRLYLKVMTVSDITTSCGQYITAAAWHGRQSQTGRNTEEWPKWGRPTLQSWSLWRSALIRTLCNNSRRLHKPLGSWIKQPENWEWYLSVDKNNLYHKDKDVLKQYKRMGRSKLTNKFNTTFTIITSMPQGALPTTVIHNSKYILADNTTKVNIIPTVCKSEIIRTPWLNVDKFIAGRKTSIKQSIENGTAIAVSDGSYRDSGIGTASWIIASSNKKDYITAGAISPGPASIQHSYRSETLGLLGILEELDNFCNEHNITDGTCVIACDGISALKQVQSLYKDILHTRFTSCDLLSACVKLKEKIPIKLVFTHVKAHQDDKEDFDTLSYPAQLNVIMDSLAKDLSASTNIEECINLTPHHHSFILPQYKSQYIYQFVKKSLAQTIAHDKAINYWIEKGRMTESGAKLINWTSHGHARKSTNLTKQRSIVKWASECLGTGKNMVRWGLRYKGHCPFCNFPIEDTKHILQCQHESPQKAWKTILGQFKSKLSAIQTNKYLLSSILKEINAWRNKKQYPSLHNLDYELSNAIRDQRIIGWKLFLEGLVAHPIIKYQERYYKSISSRRSINLWTTKLIRNGWKIITTIWTNRNNYLHQESIIQDMEGKEILHETIKNELNVGLSTLPMLEYRHMFRMKLTTILNKPMSWKKDWLATIKLARQVHEDKNSPIDIFTNNNTLREWIGLDRIQALHQNQR